jgi:radical SAM superfamily enzyme YgiQ (UPF0313 family)
MKINLYNPACFYYNGTQYRLNPALGPVLLATVLQGAGHEARAIDLEALGARPADLARALGGAEHPPDVLGFTCTALNMRAVREHIRAVRAAGYGGYILVGGPQLSTAKGLEEAPALGADAWVVGEAEGNIARLMEEQPRGEVRGERLEIDYLPTIDWSLHTPRPTQYLGNQPKVGHPEGIAMWSRGCPWRCIYCSNPLYGHQKTRLRPPRAIFEDMAALKALGVESVFVYDDEAVMGGEAQQAWLRAVAERIGELGLTWKCQGRCSEKITANTLQAMASAGCRAIMWGVESFSDKVLRDIQKDTSEADIWHTLRLAHAAGIGNWVFLMVGNYKETPRDLAYTQAQLARARAEGLVQWGQVTVCTPIEGTALYERAREEGWWVERPLTGPQMAQVYAPTPWLAEGEIRYWRERLLRTLEG